MAAKQKIHMTLMKCMSFSSKNFFYYKLKYGIRPAFLRCLRDPPRIENWVPRIRKNYQVPRIRENCLPTGPYQVPNIFLKKTGLDRTKLKRSFLVLVMRFCEDLLLCIVV